ncbi:hypothetical protein KAM461_16390 [Aeromonas hydrophila]|nr:hypothetical protein KAM461_16390 [Aeromonas hydrophila]
MAAQEVGAKLGHQDDLDCIACGKTRPNLVRKSVKCRHIASDRGIVFGSGMQSAHRLTPTFNRLFGEIIAATDPQSHLQAAQIQRWRIKIDIAEFGLGVGYNFQ